MNHTRPGIWHRILLAAVIAALMGFASTSILAQQGQRTGGTKHAIAGAPRGSSSPSHPKNDPAKKPSDTAPAAVNPPPAAAPAPAPIGQGMPAFDDIMNAALKAREIPGGALAIAKDGKLLVARGFGVANVETHEPVTVETLFCTASVSKTVTAAAVLHLVDQGKLSLDDAVFPLLGKPRALDRQTIDPQIAKITVRQLLLHSGGWDPKRTSDALRQTHKISRITAEKLPLAADTVLRYGLSQPLDFAPGAESHYSDFGYFVAKLMVEGSARQPYETYVRQQVLRPMGISEMRMEQLAPAYAAHEAHRYGPGGRELSGGREAVAAPAGDWLGSVVDMARFLTAISGTRGKPFLSSTARDQMVAAPPPPLATRRSGSHVGLGWDAVIDDASGLGFRKSGSIAGVRAYIEHRPDGIDWVLLLNSDGQVQDQPPAVGEIIGKIRQAIDAVGEWPDRDLFESPVAAHAAQTKPAGSVAM